MTGARDKSIAMIVDRQKAIRALWLACFNSSLPDGDVALEFFHAVGEILEGGALETLKLAKVSKDKVIEYYKEGA